MDHETDWHPARRRRKPGEPDQGGCTGAVAGAARTPVPQTGMTQFYAELYERVAFVCTNAGPRKWHFAFSSKTRSRASRALRQKERGGLGPVRRQGSAGIGGYCCREILQAAGEALRLVQLPAPVLGEQKGSAGDAGEDNV